MAGDLVLKIKIAWVNSSEFDQVNKKYKLWWLLKMGYLNSVDIGKHYINVIYLRLANKIAILII